MPTFSVENARDPPLYWSASELSRHNPRVGMMAKIMKAAAGDFRPLEGSPESMIDVTDA